MQMEMKIYLCPETKQRKLMTKIFQKMRTEILLRYPRQIFEENMEPDSFDVTVRAEQGTIVFETDLLQLKEEQEKLSADELLQMQEREHLFVAGEAVGFYIHPFEGYECTEVTAESEGEAVSVTLGEDQRYPFCYAGKFCDSECRV